MSYRWDELETVDWGPLASRCNPPVDVPQLLRQAWSPDGEVRRHAYSRLADVVGPHQEICEATAVVASVLIDIVADPGAPDRFAACQILTRIVAGDEVMELSGPTDWAELRSSVERKARMTKEELQDEMAAWVAAASTERERKGRERSASYADVELDRETERWAMYAYDTVRAAVPVYIAALRAPDPPTRLYAAHLLAWLREDRESIGPALKRLLDSESDPMVAAAACVAAGLCCGTDGGDGLIDHMRARRRSADPVERWSAVLGLARLLPNPDRSIIKDLYECFATAGGKFPHWPFVGGDIAWMAGFTLGQLRSNTARDLIDTLIDRLTVPDSRVDEFYLFRLLLETAFPHYPIPDGTNFIDLDAEQRKVVLWLWQTAAPTKGDTFRMVLHKYNLPQDQQALGAWCGLDLR
jgi:hypothetical protein